ncbi:hypothetical protein niasHS_017579 [Heterodera schachtii]|uniref:C-type lectin domain-containing protein n=2 Tax=Heterodera TaxID=34509 RepID=A0ABD2I415_HETSC
MVRPLFVSFPLCVIFATFSPFFGAVQQTLLIDLAKRHSANGQQFEGFDNLLTIMKGEKERVPKWGQFHAAAETPEHLLNKLGEMISSLGKMFSLRLEELSKKIDWMEANQRNFMKGNEWTEISEGKRIRKSAEQRNWTEAERMCTEMNGSLLEINSAEEKRRTFRELIKNKDDSFWWVGFATTMHSPQWANGDENGINERNLARGERQMCTGITKKGGGQRTERKCEERNQFICQIK